MNKHEQSLSIAGLIVALGIIYGDIGTSPLYVMKAIIGERPISDILVLGGISCIFWTLTLQTTFKYVLLALNADNDGEGGIFALFNLVKKNHHGLIVPAVIGAAALLADGVITPPISVTSAVEGLKILSPSLSPVPIVMVILSFIFLFQRFGTRIVGQFFGPIMLLWFILLGLLGLRELVENPAIFKAISPHYALDLLIHYPGGLVILGAVFLCTTGAEALYSDLGHCGKNNIRMSWILVKVSLILNYFGQGAYLLKHLGEELKGNPFYEIIPANFLIPGIIIATVAAVIASQALISGSFTLINEAINHQLWPKVMVHYPTDIKGQLYIPSVNFLLWMGCLGVVLYFKESAMMEGAYGLSITLAMLMTTILMAKYLQLRSGPKAFWVLVVFLGIYLPIETSFLVANMSKFLHGGYVTVLIGLVIILIMVIWVRAAAIKGGLQEMLSLPKYLQDLKDLSNDNSISKFSTHLVYLTTNGNLEEIDQKILYSIFYKRPKKADIFWFVHIEVTNEPYTMEYKVDILAPEDVVRLTFFLGFRIEQRIGQFVKIVVEDMVRSKRIDITSRYTTLREKQIAGDFHFIILERYLSEENDLPFLDQLVLNTYFFIKKFTSSRDRWYALDSSSTTIEKVPLIIRPHQGIKLTEIGQRQR